MSSNSVSNHTRDKQIGLPLRGRPNLLITDRIGLHLVLLPLQTICQIALLAGVKYTLLSPLAFSKLHCSREMHALTSSSFLIREPYVPSCLVVHVDANERLARMKQILHNIPPHNLAVFKRVMFHLNR